VCFPDKNKGPRSRVLTTIHIADFRPICGGKTVPLYFLYEKEHFIFPKKPKIQKNELRFTFFPTFSKKRGTNRGEEMGEDPGSSARCTFFVYTLALRVKGEAGNHRLGFVPTQLKFCNAFRFSFRAIRAFWVVPGVLGVFWRFLVFWGQKPCGFKLKVTC